LIYPLYIDLHFNDHSEYYPSHNDYFLIDVHFINLYVMIFISIFKVIVYDHLSTQYFISQFEFILLFLNINHFIHETICLFCSAEIPMTLYFGNVIDNYIIDNYIIDNYILDIYLMRGIII
jgi:hypothetical protein